MPELPEVETIARLLRAGRTGHALDKPVPALVGRTIIETRVLWPREINGLTAKAFERRTRGCSVISVGRHGKYLIIELDRPVADAPDESAPELSVKHRVLRKKTTRKFMLVHLRMSGRLEVVPQADAHSAHARVIWLLDDGWALRFDDARKFGRVYLVDDPAHITARTGPDALLIPGGDFKLRLKERRGALKPLLLDQAFIAGVGNIYADESLFLAGLHPKRPAQTLTEQDALRLHTAIQQVLLAAIAANGASFDWVYPGGNYQESFRVYGQTGKPCVNCGRPITRIVVGQRSTHLCEDCQKAEWR